MILPTNHSRMTDTVQFYEEKIPFRLCESPERALHVLHTHPQGATGFTHYYQEHSVKMDKNGVAYYPLFRYGDGIREIRLLHPAKERRWWIVCEDGRSDLQLPLELVSTQYSEFYLAVENGDDRKLSYTVQYVHLPLAQRMKYANMMNPLYLPSVCLSKEKEIIPQ